MSTLAMRSWLDAMEAGNYQNYIGGEWIAANSGRTYSLFESALPDRKLGDFPDSDEQDVRAAVEAAHAAFASWSRRTGADRAAILYRFADLLLQHREELAYMLSAEQGKVLGESLGEIGRAIDETRFAAGEALRIDGQTLPSAAAGVTCEIVRHPIGVVAAIAPWNFPVVTPVRKIAPALAYGCTVVYKPASMTPWTSIRLAELLAEAGVPAGVVNVVFGSGSKVGDPLVAHPLVKGISFTGSTELGTRINTIAAARFAKTQLEMGGKNAAVVLSDANLEEAAAQITAAAFACTGQRCTAISRVIVMRDVEEQLVQLLEEKIKAIVPGPAWLPESTIGPLVNQSHYEKVRRYVELAVSEGATLVAGGSRARLGEPGYYMEPALLTGVTKEMTIAHKEVFGPVLAVLAANSFDEAMETANATDYGLAASVFTNRLDHAKRAADEMESGMVHINHGTASQAHLPFGGVKLSGSGAFSIGHSNQEFYTNQKVVYTKR